MVAARSPWCDKTYKKRVSQRINKWLQKKLCTLLKKNRKKPHNKTQIFFKPKSKNTGNFLKWPHSVGNTSVCCIESARDAHSQQWPGHLWNSDFVISSPWRQHLLWPALSIYKQPSVSSSSQGAHKRLPSAGWLTADIYPKKNIYSCHVTSIVSHCWFIDFIYQPITTSDGSLPRTNRPGAHAL